MLSPSGLSSVCYGRELTLLCSTNRSYIRWNVTVLQSGRRESRSQLLSSSSQNTAPLIVGTESFVITANATNILTSTLTIANVTTTLNGTTVRCTDIGTSNTETSTFVAVVHVIKAAGTICMYFNILHASGMGYLPRD